ncbi:hypothetical protein RB195_013027 [Necator americanus]
MSSAKRKWLLPTINFTHVVPFQLSHCVLRVAVNIWVKCITSLHVNDDVLVEWRNSGREVTYNSKYLYIRVGTPWLSKASRPLVSTESKAFFKSMKVRRAASYSDTDEFRNSVNVVNRANPFETRC